MIKSLRIAMVTLLVLASAGRVALGQGLGRISGTVTDSSGAALPGVTVTMMHEATRLVTTVATDGRGFYVASSVPVGKYTVSAELSGFKKTVQTGRQLETGGAMTVAFVMELGAMSDTVEVRAEIGEAVNTVSGEIARIIDGEQMQNMALNGRNYAELTQLLPGTPVLDVGDPIAAMVGLGINMSINGSRNNENNLTVDGVYNMDSGSNASQITNVGVDFIDQVTIKTSNFSAEYGRQSGANVNVTTRSGSNDFHGGARWYQRSERLNATSSLLKSRGLENPPLDFDDYGWNLGGPIVRDKLFFFVGQAWKGVRQSTEATPRTLPTSAELRGDFSARGNIFLRDPLKTGTCNATDQTACFTDPRRIPADRITADGRAIANLFTRMQEEAFSFQDTPTANNAIFQKERPFDEYQAIARLDWRASEAHRLTGRILYAHSKTVDPYGLFIGSQVPTSPTLRDHPGDNIQLAHTWRVRPNLTNDFTAATSWNRQRTFAQGDVWRRDTYGFQFEQVYPNGGLYENATPRIAITGYATAESVSRAIITPTTDITFTEKLNWLKDSHSLTGGATYTRNRKDQNSRVNYAGNVSFATAGNPNSTGNALADALLGNYRTYAENELDPIGFYRFSNIEGFVSDNWRVSRTLSLELGMRYLYHIPTYTQGNNNTNFDPALYDPARAVQINPTTGLIVPGSGNRYEGLVRPANGVPEDELSRFPNGNSPRVLAVPSGAPRGLYREQSRLMPRASFAWAPHGDDELAIRGGVGVFYERPDNNYLFPTSANPPMNESISLENANLGDPGRGRASAVAPWGAIEAVDPDLQLARKTNWSLSVQRTIGKKLFAEIAYVGNAGRNLHRRPNINALAPDVLRSSRAIPAAQRPNDNALRPYLGYTTINYYVSDARSNYHALQVFLAKRKGDFNFTVAYTFGGNWTDASSRGEAGFEAGEDPYEGLKENYGPATNFRRHILALTYTWRVPFFRRSTGFVKGALDGWEFSGVTNMQSGRRLTPVGPTAIGSRRADYVGGDVNLPGDERTNQRYFNTGAFAPAAEDRKGNAPAGAINAPGYQRWTMKLRKRFELPRRAKLSFEVDAFNVFNSTTFGLPDVDLASASYGTILPTGLARQIQLGMKVDF